VSTSSLISFSDYDCYKSDTDRPKYTTACQFVILKFFVQTYETEFNI